MSYQSVLRTLNDPNMPPTQGMSRVGEPLPYTDAERQTALDQFNTNRSSGTGMLGLARYAYDTANRDKKMDALLMKNRGVM